MKLSLARRKPKADDSDVEGERMERIIERNRSKGNPAAVSGDDCDFRPLREFCVSVFRQNQEYYVFNVHDEGLFPLVTFLPEGWDGMRAGTA